MTWVLPTLEIQYSVTTVAPAPPFHSSDRMKSRQGEDACNGRVHKHVNLPNAGHATVQDTVYDTDRVRTQTLAWKGSSPNVPPSTRSGPRVPIAGLVVEVKVTLVKGWGYVTQAAQRGLYVAQRLSTWARL